MLPRIPRLYSYWITLRTGAAPGSNMIGSGAIYLAAFLLLTSIPASAQKPVPHSVMGSAVYVGLDTSAQGSWSGNYGLDGNLIANDSTQPPGYARVSFKQAVQNTWAASTSDVRALQLAKGSTTRIASIYSSETQNYSSNRNFSINLQLTDGNTHQIALYLLDWSSQGITEDISILDAKSLTVLDTRSFSGFSNGQYAIWNITGNVLIRVTPTNQSNAAVVAGIFFDPASSYPNRLETFSVQSYGGKCLDFGPPPQVIGAPVFLYECNGSAAQQVRVVEPDKSAAGNHSVLLAAGGKVIGLSANDLADGSTLELQDQRGSPAQMFQLDGDSILLAANRNMVVEVQNNRGVNHTPLVLGTRELKNAEFWSFHSLDRLAPQPTSGFVVLPANVTGAALLAALKNASFGSVIVLDDAMDLSFTDPLPLTLNPGVTLRSDRRLTNFGARLTFAGTAATASSPRCGLTVGFSCIVVDARTAPWSRVTGLRMTGPSLTEAKDGTWETTGILTDDSSTAIIDHNEFSGWTAAGVGGSYANVGKDPNLVNPAARTPTVKVLRNFIHHNERSDLGYGVVSGDGSIPLIQGNTFLLNRHAIADDGTMYSGYRAYDNLVLNQVPGYKKTFTTQREQDFDMHGDKPTTIAEVVACGGTEHCGGLAGDFIDIARNTFLGTALTLSTHYSFFLRGQPQHEALFHDNVVRQSESDAIKFVSKPSHLTVTNNHFDVSNPTDHLGVGDFDGDGKDDLFLATGQAWYYSPGGKVEWRFLRAATEPLSALLFGDFDGDGRTDAFTQIGTEWFVSWGGASRWEKINNFTGQFSDLAVGDFDGDGRSDIFYGDGHNWFVFSAGSGTQTQVQTSSYKVSNLAFGDLNGDGRTDVLGVVSGNWMVSYGATSSWTLVRSKLTDSAQGLIIADFTGDGKPDIAQLQSGSLKISVSGTGNWVNRSEFSNLAAVGRFLSHSQAPDVLVWDDDYLNILPGGTQAPTRHNPESMR